MERLVGATGYPVKTNTNINQIKIIMKTLNEKLEEAFVCKDCKGSGESYVPYMDSDGNISPTDTETCENCFGSGEEPDEEIVKERLSEIISEMSDKLLDLPIEEIKKILCI